MTSHQAPQTLRTSAGVLMLLAVAAPRLSAAQPTLESVADGQRQIIEEIEQEQSRNGPHSEALIGPLTALALHYRENGDRGLATGTIERVRQIVRVNYGLHSLEQAPLIQQLIADQEAHDNVETVWELEQELLKLARRNPDDLRTVPILRGAADRRAHVLRRFLSGELPREVVLGCYYDWKTGTEDQNCISGANRDAVRTLSLDARRNYADAIAVILRNEIYSSDDLRELEMSLVRSADLVRSYNERPRRHVDFVGIDLRDYAFSDRWQAAMKSLDRLTTWARERSTDVLAVEHGDSDATGTEGSLTMSLSNYLTGRLSLQRLFAYEDATSASWPSRAGALVRIADWDLMHSENRSALEGYELAYEILEASSARSSIHDLFSPETPVVLPAFRPNPLTSPQESEQALDYVDVAFDITRYGKSRRVEVLETTTSATDLVIELVHVIKGSRFRPRVTNGQFDSSRVTVRYYFDE